MNSYSQSKQDMFAHLVNPSGGFFLDVGSSIPTWQSNTKALMELGTWTGIAVDAENHQDAWVGYPAKFIHADATQLDWSTVSVPKRVEYLSCDCDISTYNALFNITCHGISFNCATIEHDKYRFGDQLKEPLLRHMQDCGYILIAEDVGSSAGFPFENWYCHPSTPNIPAIKEVVATWL